ncbi:hypothetical protein D3C80_1326400 [compost metagenome]
MVSLFSGLPISEMEVKPSSFSGLFSTVSGSSVNWLSSSASTYRGIMSFSHSGQLCRPVFLRYRRCSGRLSSIGLCRSGLKLLPDRSRAISPRMRAKSLISG